MTTRIAITGVGGPSGVSLLLALAGNGIELVGGDIDPYAPGLYLVDEPNRLLLRRGDAPDFVDDLLARCIRARVGVVIPTVDSELLPLAKRIAEFERQGIRVLVASERTLSVCLDKATLIERCAGVCPVPRTEILADTTNLGPWAGPCLIKPRRGSGGRGVQRVDDGLHLPDVPRDGSYILQEFLSGEEYSVDTLCSTRGDVLATVPRSRLKIDSGIAVTGKTVHDDALQRQASAVAAHLGVTFVANVQFRRDAAGVPKLLEVNARFPGTMPLTIAAGVNMPKLALDLLLDRPVPDDCGVFRDIGMVRFWQERFVETSEIETLERHAADLRSPLAPLARSA